MMEAFCTTQRSAENEAEAGVPCLTSLDTARALLLSLATRKKGANFALATIDEYMEGRVMA